MSIWGTFSSTVVNGLLCYRAMTFTMVINHSLFLFRCFKEPQRDYRRAHDKGVRDAGCCTVMAVGYGGHQSLTLGEEPMAGPHILLLTLWHGVEVGRHKGR